MSKRWRLLVVTAIAVATLVAWAAIQMHPRVHYPGFSGKTGFPLLWYEWTDFGDPVRASAIHLLANFAMFACVLVLPARWFLSRKNLWTRFTDLSLIGSCFALALAPIHFNGRVTNIIVSANVSSADSGAPIDNAIGWIFPSHNFPGAQPAKLIARASREVVRLEAIETKGASGRSDHRGVLTLHTFEVDFWQTNLVGLLWLDRDLTLDRMNDDTLLVHADGFHPRFIPTTAAAFEVGPNLESNYGSASMDFGTVLLKQDENH